MSKKIIAVLGRDASYPNSWCVYSVGKLSDVYKQKDCLGLLFDNNGEIKESENKFEIKNQKDLMNKTEKLKIKEMKECKVYPSFLKRGEFKKEVQEQLEDQSTIECTLYVHADRDSGIKRLISGPLRPIGKTIRINGVVTDKDIRVNSTLIEPDYNATATWVTEMAKDLGYCVSKFNDIVRSTNGDESEKIEPEFDHKKKNDPEYVADYLVKFWGDFSKFYKSFVKGKDSELIDENMVQDYQAKIKSDNWKEERWNYGGFIKIVYKKDENGNETKQIDKQKSELNKKNEVILAFEKWIEIIQKNLTKMQDYLEHQKINDKDKKYESSYKIANDIWDRYTGFVQEYNEFVTKQNKMVDAGGSNDAVLNRIRKGATEEETKEIKKKIVLPVFKDGNLKHKPLEVLKNFLTKKAKRCVLDPEVSTEYEKLKAIRNDVERISTSDTLWKCLGNFFEELAPMYRNVLQRYMNGPIKDITSWYSNPREEENLLKGYFDRVLEQIQKHIGHLNEVYENIEEAIKGQNQNSSTSRSSDLDIKDSDKKIEGGINMAKVDTSNFNNMRDSYGKFVKDHNDFLAKLLRNQRNIDDIIISSEEYSLDDDALKLWKSKIEKKIGGKEDIIPDKITGAEMEENKLSEEYKNFVENFKPYVSSNTKAKFESSFKEAGNDSTKIHQVLSGMLENLNGILDEMKERLKGKKNTENKAEEPEKRGIFKRAFDRAKDFINGSDSELEEQLEKYNDFKVWHNGIIDKYGESFAAGILGEAGYNSEGWEKRLSDIKILENSKTLKGRNSLYVALVTNLLPFVSANKKNKFEKEFGNINQIAPKGQDVNKGRDLLKKVLKNVNKGKELVIAELSRVDKLFNKYVNQLEEFKGNFNRFEDARDALAKIIGVREEKELSEEEEKELIKKLKEQGLSDAEKYNLKYLLVGKHDRLKSKTYSSEQYSVAAEAGFLLLDMSKIYVTNTVFLQCVNGLSLKGANFGQDNITFTDYGDAVTKLGEMMLAESKIMGILSQVTDKFGKKEPEVTDSTSVQDANAEGTNDLTYYTGKLKDIQKNYNGFIDRLGRYISNLSYEDINNIGKVLGEEYNVVSWNGGRKKIEDGEIYNYLDGLMITAGNWGKAYNYGKFSAFGKYFNEKGTIYGKYKPVFEEVLKKSSGLTDLGDSGKSKFEDEDKKKALDNAIDALNSLQGELNKAMNILEGKSTGDAVLQTEPNQEEKSQEETHTAQSDAKSQNENEKTEQAEVENEEVEGSVPEKDDSKNVEENRKNKQESQNNDNEDNKNADDVKDDKGVEGGGVNNDKKTAEQEVEMPDKVVEAKEQLEIVVNGYNKFLSDHRKFVKKNGSNEEKFKNRVLNGCKKDIWKAGHDDFKPGKCDDMQEIFNEMSRLLEEVLEFSSEREKSIYSPVLDGYKNKFNNTDNTEKERLEIIEKVKGQIDSLLPSVNFVLTKLSTDPSEMKKALEEAGSKVKSMAKQFSTFLRGHGEFLKNYGEYKNLFVKALVGEVPEIGDNSWWDFENVKYEENIKCEGVSDIYYGWIGLLSGLLLYKTGLQYNNESVDEIKTGFDRAKGVSKSNLEVMEKFNNMATEILKKLSEMQGKLNEKTSGLKEEFDKEKLVELNEKLDKQIKIYDNFVDEYNRFFEQVSGKIKSRLPGNLKDNEQWVRKKKHSSFSKQASYGSGDEISAGWEAFVGLLIKYLPKSYASTYREKMSDISNKADKESDVTKKLKIVEEYNVLAKKMLDYLENVIEDLKTKAKEGFFSKIKEAVGYESKTNGDSKKLNLSEDDFEERVKESINTYDENGEKIQIRARYVKKSITEQPEYNLFKLVANKLCSYTSGNLDLATTIKKEPSLKSFGKKLGEALRSDNITKYRVIKVEDLDNRNMIKTMIGIIYIGIAYLPSGSKGIEAACKGMSVGGIKEGKGKGNIPDDTYRLNKNMKKLCRSGLVGHDLVKQLKDDIKLFVAEDKIPKIEGKFSTLIKLKNKAGKFFGKKDRKKNKQKDK